MDPNQIHPETLQPAGQSPLGGAQTENLPSNEPPNEIEQTKKLSKRILLIVFLLLAIIIPSALFAYSKLKPTEYKSVPYEETIQAPISTPTPTPDPTTDWTSYLSQKGKFTLKYPPSWQQPSNKELCDPGFFDRTIYLGPDKNSVLVCASSYGGQMYLSSIDGDKRAEYDLDTGFTNIKKASVKVDGITGKRIEAIYSGQEGEGGYTNGSKVVRYLFYANNRTYVANYYQALTGNPSQNVLGDFDLMLKTLKFTDQASPSPSASPDQTACTQEAKICPDGSYVSREGPNCEFEACPN